MILNKNIINAMIDNYSIYPVTSMESISLINAFMQKLDNFINTDFVSYMAASAKLTAATGETNEIKKLTSANKLIIKRLESLYAILLAAKGDRL